MLVSSACRCAPHWESAASRTARLGRYSRMRTDANSFWTTATKCSAFGLLPINFLLDSDPDPATGPLGPRWFLT
jgi:hypothetical protein